MAVELTFNDEVTGVSPQEAERLIADLHSLDGNDSSTSGVYDVDFIRYQFEKEDQDSRCHISVTLRDSDDDDYPHVKDDLADAVERLGADLGDSAEIHDTIRGEML